MASFIIGDTNFQVDLAKSAISWHTGADAKRELNIDIFGKEDTFDSLSEPEDSPWSWALYPPAFFLHGFPIPEQQKEATQFWCFDAASEEYELGIYMMEYRDLSDLRMELSSERFAISGNVEFFGKVVQFSIDMPLTV